MSSRNLSTAEYFTEVQKEYLIAEFRKKIYHNTKDRAYYERVMLYKREKIEDITNRTQLKNIFTSVDKMREMRSMLFNSAGFPMFELLESDWSEYYSVGCDYSYDGEVYKLADISYNTQETMAVLKRTLFDGKIDKKITPLNKICRIL